MAEEAPAVLAEQQAQPEAALEDAEAAGTGAVEVAEL